MIQEVTEYYKMIFEGLPNTFGNSFKAEKFSSSESSYLMEFCGNKFRKYNEGFVIEFLDGYHSIFNGVYCFHDIRILKSSDEWFYVTVFTQTG